MAGEEQWPRLIARIYREDRRRILATLVRLLGDFDLAEEALNDAFAAAVEQWPVRGVPRTPWTWLVSAGRFRTIDRLRRRARFDAAKGELARRLDQEADDAAGQEPEMLADDSLTLIFTCCHPALAPDAQAALTLREVCGLTTEEIARAFLTAAPTVAQRIVRAKGRIRDAGLPYEVPDRPALPARLENVCQVIYLVFSEAYAAADGRPDLAVEAIRLGRLLAELLPDPEVMGLLALMLLQDSRRAARVTARGELVLLPDQDRRLWNAGQIAEGLGLLEQAYAMREIGRYTLQAAIAAEHARATTAATTDWRRIVEIYDTLLLADPSPVVELNRAAAISMCDGPAAALPLIDDLLERGVLAGYHLAYAARADLQRQLGRTAAAAADYRRALELAPQAPERAFLAGRLRELEGKA